MPDRTWTVLVVEAQQPVRQSLARCLEEDYQVIAVGSGHEALAVVRRSEVDLVLCDLALPDMTGIAFFGHIRIANPDIIRILRTEWRDPNEVIRSINEAAVYQIIARTWQADQLRLVIRRALESRELARLHRHLSRELKFDDDVVRNRNRRMRTRVQDAHAFDRLVFASDGMIAVCNLARQAAATDLPVLIQGETGTGKELMARAVHLFSTRSLRPFLARNCGAMPEGLLPRLFAEADGGTVFLDEIGESSAAFQTSLLRFLQSGEAKLPGGNVIRPGDVRIVAACSQRLRELVEQNRFRRDLYFRLRGFELALPPLRDRLDDIPVLAEHAASAYARSINRKIAGISPEVMRRLRAHAFPGNVRELENEMRRMVALAADGEFLSVRHMSPEFARLTIESDTRMPVFLKGKGTLKSKVERLEAHLVSDALLRHKWNHTRAARDLGLSRVGLANKIRRYSLDRIAAS